MGRGTRAFGSVLCESAEQQRGRGCGSTYLGLQWPSEAGWLVPPGTKSSITSAHRAHEGKRHLACLGEPGRVFQGLTARTRREPQWVSEP